MRRLLAGFLVFLLMVIAVTAAITFTGVKYAYEPALDNVLNSNRPSPETASPELRRMNVQGTGHNFWVDSPAGFTHEQQRALVLYLLIYRPGE